jgi:hypothetical protein
VDELYHDSPNLRGKHIPLPNLGNPEDIRGDWRASGIAWNAPYGDKPSLIGTLGPKSSHTAHMIARFARTLSAIPRSERGRMDAVRSPRSEGHRPFKRISQVASALMAAGGAFRLLAGVVRRTDLAPWDRNHEHDFASFRIRTGARSSRRFTMFAIFDPSGCRS